MELGRSPERVEEAAEVSWEEWVSLAALVLAVAAVVVGLVVLARLSEARRKAPALNVPRAREEAPGGRPAFVINPIKVGSPGELRRLATAAAESAGLDTPMWFETTPNDPGGGQARRAVEQGAVVVVAAGGDGTVRAVADALTGTGVPMALIPMGTGNLLARNLDLPLGDTRALATVALTGRDHAVDVGYLRVEVGTQAQHPGAAPPDAEREPHADPEHPGAARPATGSREHCFLVMSGLGFDAAMVAGADNEMKRRMGWFAYFLAGARHLHGRKVLVTMNLGDAQEVRLRLRSLLFANCGRLPGGIVLFPDAEIDDGWLDIAGIDTKGGVIGWASLFGKVVLQGLGIRRELPISAGSIEFWRAREVVVTTEEAEPVQVDGDLVGEATQVRVSLRQGALTVRTR